MGFVVQLISSATGTLCFAQPDRALIFYNFVCSAEGKSNTTRNALADNKTDREIIYYYVLYHYLLFKNDTTAANALIGTWQKNLGHQIFWEDFSRDYRRGSPPTSSNECISSRRPCAPARESTGGIPEPNPEEAKHLSEKYPWFYGDLLTPQQSSDEDDTPPPITTRLRKPLPPPIGNVVSRSNSGLPSRDPNGYSTGHVGQTASHNYTLQDVNMDAADEPPPTPPQDIGFLAGSFASETADSAAFPTQLVRESADDPMNGTSVSAACFRSEREPSQYRLGGGKSHSAPVPPPTAPHRKKRRKASLNPKKKPPKKPNRVEEPAVDQPMSIDTPVVSDPGPNPESPSLKLSAHSPISTTSIAPESRVPLSISYINIPLSRSTSGPSYDPLPDGTPAIVSPGVSRPILSGNPPIWAQVRTSPLARQHRF